MTPVFVRGLGLWTPGYRGPASWFRAAPDREIREPDAALLSGPGRRRATPLTRMAAEAFSQAAIAAGMDPTSVPSVWASAHADHEIQIAILEMLQRGEGRLSPTKFHNSVYNAASGHVSIATGNRSASTTLAGGADLVAMCLLEAICWLEAGESEIVAVLFDQPLLPPFDAREARAPLALAFSLSRTSEGAVARLSQMRRDTVAPVKWREPFGGLYVSAALSLVEQIYARRPGCVSLELESDLGGPKWCVELDFAGAPIPVEPR